jgi:hypothetical protein
MIYFDKDQVVPFNKHIYYIQRKKTFTGTYIFILNILYYIMMYTPPWDKTFLMTRKNDLAGRFIIR